MSVRLRLKRFGRRHQPYFRLCAMDIHTPRDGSALEELGSYNPVQNQDGSIVNLNTDRVKYWLSVGALPTESVASLLRKSGIDIPKWAKHKHKRPKREKAAEAPKADAAAAAAPAAPAAEGEKK